MSFSRFELWERLVQPEKDDHQEYAIKAVSSIENIEYTELIEWLGGSYTDIDEDSLTGEFLIELKDSMVDFLSAVMPRTESSQNMGCIGYFLDFEQEKEDYYYFHINMKSLAEMRSIVEALGINQELPVVIKDSLYEFSDSFFLKFINAYCDGYLDIRAESIDKKEELFFSRLNG